MNSYPSLDLRSTPADPLDDDGEPEAASAIPAGTCQRCGRVPATDICPACERAVRLIPHRHTEAPGVLCTGACLVGGASC